MVDSWTVRWMRQSTCTGLMPRVCLKVHISEKHRCSRSKFNTTVHALEEWCECVLEANIVSPLMWEKQIDVRSFSLFCVGSCLSSSSFPPSLSLPLFLRCERGEARWVAMSEGMQQWGRWSFISLWKVYFSLVNRHGCILDSPSQSPSFPLYFFLSGFASLSLPLSLSSSLLSGAVQRTDWGYYFSATEFFCHAVILKVPLCSCVQDKSKTFFYSCNQCPSRFSTALPFPHLRYVCRHVHTLKTHIHSLLCFFLRRWFSLERWHQIASLQQSTPLGGICIVFASHYRFNRANCAPSWVKMMRGEVERWR